MKTEKTGLIQGSFIHALHRLKKDNDDKDFVFALLYFAIKELNISRADIHYILTNVHIQYGDSNSNPFNQFSTTD